MLAYEEIEAKVLARRHPDPVRASGLNAADWHIMRADQFLARSPGCASPVRRIIDSDVAGIVESVGDKATRFSPALGVCRIDDDGCAELVVVPEDRAARRARARVRAGRRGADGWRDRPCGRFATTAPPAGTWPSCGASGGVGTFAVRESLVRSAGRSQPPVARAPSSWSGLLGDGGVDYTVDADRCGVTVTSS